MTVATIHTHKTTPIITKHVFGHLTTSNFLVTLLLFSSFLYHQAILIPVLALVTRLIFDFLS